MPPTLFECAVQWRAVSEAMMVALQEWRLQPPKPTLQEIEAAIDEGLAELRGRMLQDMALASRVADVSQTSPPERQVTTHQGKTLRLQRSYVRCPACQVGFFPPRRRVGLAAWAAHPTVARKPGAAGHLAAFCAGG